MDPHNFIARAEAQRWLGIAEKLLMSHDLVGSKTFAIRARDSDPRLEAADQILAIADTLLAAEKRVVGNNGSQQPDYYAILQLVRFIQETDHIADQYRRLAVALNPNQNRFPYSDQAFQLVNEAWAVLSNPMRKSIYDSELDFAPQQQQMNSLGFNLEQQHHQQPQHQQQQQQHQQQQHQHNFFSINQELPDSPQTFQNRLQQSHQQLQQHNFLSQPNPSVREQEHLFQHREQEQLFQPQVQPFQVTSPPHQQTRPSPQPRTPIHSPPPAASQPPFSWQQEHLQQQLQQKQIKQEHQQHQHTKQEQLKQQQLREEQLKQQKLQQEHLKQQQIQQEQLKQQRMQEEQLKQQRLQEEQLKQQRSHEEQLKQQRIQEEQLKQQRIQEEQLKQQRLQEEQLKQQRLQEEQLKQQRLQEEQLKQQRLQEEQLKQQRLQEEQLKQQRLQEEQLKQQRIHEEQLRQQQEQLKQQQMLQEQQKQQHMQQEQQKQQQESLKQNVAPVQLPTQVNSNNGVREEETVPEAEVEAETETADESMDDSPTFWTSCPYCFYMYEYPKLYADCTLRCDNCERAFQAVRISSPPPIVEGQDAYFCCWGFIPVGVSMSHLEKDNKKGTNSNWTPFSPLFDASKNVHSHLNEWAAPKKNAFVNKSSGPRIYFDDNTEDVYIGVSDPSDGYDAEWDRPMKNNLKRTKKVLDPGFKERIQVLGLMALKVRNGSVKNLKHGKPVQKVVSVLSMPVEEMNKKVVGNNPRMPLGPASKELGKLDLNVEFNNNEKEERAQQMSTGPSGHGEEDNIEGIGFFEGLDEFISSMPILSVVNEGKVMAA